ncbi:MAG: HAMP domain-containing histidine kinase [Chloroflexota bacterium]|nr:HAMP domain-containing histidine kinase [Chloroflexota bacterium]
MQRRSLFLTAHPWRAALEALLLSALVGIVLLLLHRQAGLFNLFLVLILLSGPICMLVFALRLRFFKGSWWRRALIELALAGLLSYILSGVAQVAVIFILHDIAFPSRGSGIDNPHVILVVTLLLDMAVFVALRLGIRVWLFWDRLRRRQLIWALTHAHVMLVAIGAGLLIALIELIAFVSSRSIYVIVPTTVGLLVLGSISLLVVVPPSALFSYLVMRRTTDRVKMLAAATSALRVGNYAIRVPVVGEDEVAQLQSNFNAMAADLERAMRDLKAERDTVAGLLQSRRELVANVSHELRTPVATIRGYLETTLTHWDDVSAPPLRQDVQVMENEVIRLQALVDDLFALARAEVGRLTLRCVPTDVGELVRRVVAVRAPLAWRASKIEVSADTPPAGPCALVDPERLEQVLQNLLHNGVRHTSPGGIVAVAVTSEPGAVVLHVRDTGEGIAPGDVPHIWERFYQANNARAHIGGGSGLGLSLVKEWIEAMQGSVAVESVPGEGSCFTLRLPASPTCTERVHPS